jgi:hypothetical protein
LLAFVSKTDVLNANLFMLNTQHWQLGSDSEAPLLLCEAAMVAASRDTRAELSFDLSYPSGIIFAAVHQGHVFPQL